MGTPSAMPQFLAWHSYQMLRKGPDFAQRLGRTKDLEAQFRGGACRLCCSAE